MGTRSWLNLGLFALAIVLVALVVYEPGRQAPVAAKLTALDPSQVSRLRLLREGQETLVLERAEQGWQLLTPITVAANEFRISSLLQLLSTTSHAQYPVPEDALGKYGLDSPRASLEVDGAAIRFGDTDPVNRRRYVLYQGVVHLITDTFFHQLRIELPSYVSTALLPPGNRIRRLTLPEFRLQQGEQGGWESIPDQAGLSPDARSTLISAWERARALRLTRAFEATPSARVTVELDAGPAIEFAVLKQDEGIVLQRDDLGIAYHLAPGSGAALAVAPAAAGP